MSATQTGMWVAASALVLSSKPLMCCSEPAPSALLRGQPAPCRIHGKPGGPLLRLLLSGVCLTSFNSQAPFLVPLSKRLGFFLSSSHLHCLILPPNWGHPRGKLVRTKWRRKITDLPTLFGSQGPLSQASLSWRPCPSAGCTAPEVGVILWSNLGVKKRKATPNTPTPERSFFKFFFLPSHLSRVLRSEHDPIIHLNPKPSLTGKPRNSRGGESSPWQRGAGLKRRPGLGVLPWTCHTERQPQTRPLWD